MKIMVLGSGGWGTALAVMLTQSGHDVTLWSFLKEEHETLARDRENRQFLAGVPFPEGLKLTADMQLAADAQLVVIATPSFAVANTAKSLSAIIQPGTIVVTVSKGIDRETGHRLSEVAEEALGDRAEVVVLSGPSHAEEVGRGVPTTVVAASKNKHAAETVQDVFMNDRFRVYITPDVIGVELGAALKNVIALCAGMCDGMGLGDNTKAALMTRGLTEMARLGVALGGRSETFAGLAGVGDLIVTCTSMHSRNRRAGILIGKGTSPEQAVKEIGAVVEGYYATQTGMMLAQRAGIEMPITQAAYDVLYHGKSPNDMMRALMTRGKKSETEEVWMKHIVWEE